MLKISLNLWDGEVKYKFWDEMFWQVNLAKKTRHTQNRGKSEGYAKCVLKLTPVFC